MSMSLIILCQKFLLTYTSVSLLEIYFWLLVCQPKDIFDFKNHVDWIIRYIYRQRFFYVMASGGLYSIIYINNSQS